MINVPPEQEITVRRIELADAYLDALWESHPELMERYGMEREAMRTNAQHHISCLAEAAQNRDPEIYADWVSWLHSMLMEHGVPEQVIRGNLTLFRDTMLDELPEELHEIVMEAHVAALEQLRGERRLPPSHLSEDAPRADLAHRYMAFLLDAQHHAANRLILEAVKQGVHVREIYRYVFEPVLKEVGRLWQIDEISVADEHYVTAMTLRLMAMLTPHIQMAPRSMGTVVTLCVGDELHEVGARMVSDFFEMEGWDSIYLGANTPTEAVIRTLTESGAKLLALSATMTRHIQRVRELIALVREKVGEDVTILVGGNAFNSRPNLWKNVEADGWAPSSDEAVRLARELSA